MMESAKRKIKHFVKTTTFHGFKYLYSGYYFDSILWVTWCCASACLAGVLCSVLWTRFQQVPVLLSLGNPITAYQRMPQIGVCPTPRAAAFLFSESMSVNKNETSWLTALLERILRRQKVGRQPLVHLEYMLDKHNLTLREALEKFMPPCEKIVQKCRWQNDMIPCDKLFKKQINQWGICCVMSTDTYKYRARFLEENEELLITLYCAYGGRKRGCQFYTKYSGEDWVEIEPILMQSGYYYFAHTSFASLQDTGLEKLVQGQCVSTQPYSYRKCLAKCNEQQCGCSDPLQTIPPNEVDTLPACPVAQLRCFIDFIHENNTCGCLPSCIRTKSYTNIEYIPLRFNHFTFDPIYANLNETSAVVLRIRIKVGASKIFHALPTETWLTLMSSLGGVFSMFLGVGLFSGLEILVLLLIKLPVTIKFSAFAHPNVRHRVSVINK